MAPEFQRLTMPAALIAPPVALWRLWTNVAPIRSRPVRLAPDTRAAELAADDGLAAPAIERDAAAGADPTQWRRPSRMASPAPDTRPAGAGHRRQFDAAAPAAIRADEGLPPGVDVGGAHAVGHDDGPPFFGGVPPAHVTEFRRNGGKPKNSAACVTRYGDVTR